MTIQTIISIVMTAMVIVGVVYLIYTKQYDKLRRFAYGLFLEAEHAYAKQKKAGQFKMEMVLERIYDSYVPKWVRIFMPPERLQIYLQEWFTEIKDLLDDGKNNDTAELEV